MSDVRESVFYISTWLGSAGGNFPCSHGVSHGLIVHKQTENQIMPKLCSNNIIIILEKLLSSK